MEQIYSYKGAYPYPLPTDMSNYNIKDFVLAPEKPNLLPGQQLEWVNNRWVVREPNASEIDFKWQEIRNLRNQLLAESDIHVIRFFETRQPAPPELVNYRQQLRDLTKQLDPFNIIWPTLN